MLRQPIALEAPALNVLREIDGTGHSIAGRLAGPHANQV
jgi:hypothetical protein